MSDPGTQTPLPEFHYPDLPVSRRRKEIAAALARRQVVIIVGETGSGKTTQLPKIAMEVAGRQRGKLGCTQPRRLAAVAVAKRIAEEMNGELGGYVGYQVRFDDRTSKDTKLKLMTDGILLAETQADPDLKQYHTIILDEAHERSLNVDFLLGYMKLLLKRRKDLKLIISSATMDAAAFSNFFDGAPVISVEGRTYHVDVHYMPPLRDEEELEDHVCRAVEWLSSYDARGDALIFLPGEREIKDCAAALEYLNLPRTDILPLFARLGLAEQQRIFHPTKGRRRIVLATNVAETSLTIPGIVYVIDSGLARISRYLPGRQIQRLQVENISQASAGQRAGRCGRITEGVCIRLYSQADFAKRDAYTDPEIKRSSLAGVILRMAALKLPPLGEFPLPDPPSPRLINEGYKTLREIGAMDRRKRLTPIGAKLAKLPLDPRHGRMLMEAHRERALPEMLVIVAALGIMDPRERPEAEQTQADQAHALWKNADSDFLSLLSLWRSSLAFVEKGRLRRNRLRKWCDQNYIHFLRMVEWHNLALDLRNSLRDAMRWDIPDLPPENEQSAPEMIHRSLLAGAPLQIGVWRPEDKVYRGAGGREFAIFPGSGLFRRNKRPEWIMGCELVETSRLWMRRAAVLDPKWLEQVAPQLCSGHAYDATWDKASGQVFAKERITCGGLVIIDGRRVSYSRYNLSAAREIMIRDGIIAMQLRDMPPFLQHLAEMKEDVRATEDKLRRRDLIWSPEAVYSFFNDRIPPHIASEKALRQWRDSIEKKDPRFLFIPREECVYPGEDTVETSLYPDTIRNGGQEYAVYYNHAPGEEDDGVTLGVHIDQLKDMPAWLPGWGVPAHLATRVEILLRTLPKDLRTFLLPIAQTARDFAALWENREPNRSIEEELAAFVAQHSGRFCNAGQIELSKLPDEYITKIWVCNDEGEELAMGADAEELRERLSSYREKRFRQKASRRFSTSPMTRWDCGDLPESVAIGDGTGYPALADMGDRVRISVLATREEAEATHRAGVRRLALLKHSDFINGIRKRLPIRDVSSRMALATLGERPKENIRELIAAGVNICLRPLPRTAENFDAACLHMRENLHDALANTLSKLWDQFVETEQQIRSYCLTAVQAPHGSIIASDIQRDWQWLTRNGFLSSLAPEQLQDVSRFLRGIQERLAKIKRQAIARELERIETFESHVPPSFYERYAKHKDSLSWLQYGMIIAEYRLTLFAPSLAIKGRASAKKLEEARKTLHDSLSVA